MAEKMPTSRTDSAVRKHGAKKYARGYAAGLTHALAMIRAAHKEHPKGMHQSVALKVIAGDLQTERLRIMLAIDPINLTDE